MKMLPLHIIIVLSTIFLTGKQPTFAQHNLDQHYSSTSHNVQFSYASAWDALVDASDPDFVLLGFAWNDDFMLIGFYTPQVVARLSENATTIETVTDGLMEFLDNPDTRKIQLGARTAIEAVNQRWHHLIIDFLDGRFGLVSATMNSGTIEGERELVHTIAMTYSPASDAGSDAETAATIDGEPIQLEKFDAEHRLAMQELELLGLVPSGSMLIYQHDLATLEHLGYYAITMGRRAPRTNVVIAAEISMFGLQRDHIYNHEQSCGFVARISGVDERINGGVELGFFPSNLVGLIDFNSAARVRWHADIPYDHTAPIHLMMILYGKEATVFMNGRLLTKEPLAVEEVNGVYALTSRNEGSVSCEFRNIWVYELPDYETGVCEVISNRDATLSDAPGSGSEQRGTLQANTSRITNGSSVATDGSIWYQLASGGWVRADLVSLRGDCANLPEVEP